MPKTTPHRQPTPQTSTPDAEAVRQYLIRLQDQLCRELAVLDGSGNAFSSDLWSRPEGGGGLTRTFSNGNVFEKGGVNFSDVSGSNLPASALGNRPELSGATFRAMGVSLVLHPKNPYVPTTHFNVRFFEAKIPGSDKSHWWFGGGFDLTPYYGFDTDAHHFHKTAHAACAPFGEELYPEFKDWADRYFFLKHRDEARGIGGLFFDDFNRLPFDQAFSFIQSIGSHFLPAYVPIVEKRKDHPFGSRERTFQLIRRGRYVEFNLIYDRGTLFGLQSGGRTESILMSLPPMVSWEYQHTPEPDSPESELYEKYLVPQDWLTLNPSENAHI